MLFFKNLKTLWLNCNCLLLLQFSGVRSKEDGGRRRVCEQSQSQSINNWASLAASDSLPEVSTGSSCNSRYHLAMVVKWCE